MKKKTCEDCGSEAETVTECRFCRKPVCATCYIAKHYEAHAREETPPYPWKP